MRQPLDIVGPSYSDSSKAVSSQETINWYPELVETKDGRNKWVLKGAEGTALFSSIGGESMRGLHQTQEFAYAVSGGRLYLVDAAGGSTDLGAIAGTGLVCMADNRVAGGNQIVIVNGAQGYVYDTSGPGYAQITDPDFLAADVVDFLDNYLIFNRTGTADWFWSNLANASSYAALDIATKESQTDNLVTLKVNHGLVHLLGKRSMETHAHTGDPLNPFQRINGASFGIGAASKLGRCTVNDRFYWLGHDGKAYTLNGYVPQRISTHAIEQDMAAEDLTTCFMWGYSTRGHDFVVFTFPNGKTWVFDAVLAQTVGKDLAWHRRASNTMNKWRANCYAYCYGKHLVGDSVTGKIGYLDPATYTEYDGVWRAERKTAVGHNHQNDVVWNDIEPVLDTGHGTISGQGSDPVMEMSYSDDFGNTWQNFRQESLGKTGQYGKRVKFEGLGSGRNRQYWFRVADPVKRDFIACTADMETQDA